MSKCLQGDESPLSSSPVASGTPSPAVDDTERYPSRASYTDGSLRQVLGKHCDVSNSIFMSVSLDQYRIHCLEIR